MKKILIAAVAQNGIIGKGGNVPWHSQEELQFFKDSTLGFPVVMGRKTWESLGKPLQGRLNIVITRNQEYFSPYHEVVFFYSLQQALNFCMTSIYEKIFIIGGGEIFSQSLDSADEMIISEMNFTSDGDIKFPDIDLTKWVLDSNELFNDFTVHHYIRK